MDLITYHPIVLAVSGETLEVEVNELTKGLQDIQKDIEEVSDDDVPGDMFRQVMTVSFLKMLSHIATTIKGPLISVSSLSSLIITSGH